MKAIIYGADDDYQKWEACRVAYNDMLSTTNDNAEYTLTDRVRVFAQRGKHSITITVQPDEIEASK